VEIFFKARLMKEHWSLVVTRPENANMAVFKAGESKSVGLDDAINRLKNIAGESFSDDAKNTFESLRKHRNRLVHFFHKDYIETSVDQAVIANVVSEQCRAWLHLHRLLTSQWQRYFGNFTQQLEELNTLMLAHREFLTEKFKSLKTELQESIQMNAKIVTCSSCGYHAAKQIEGGTVLLENECLVCGYRGRYLPIPCPHCKKEQIYTGDRTMDCPDCGQAISVDDIVEKYAYEGVRPKEREDIRLAYCHCCQYPSPSVAKLSRLSWEFDLRSGNRERLYATASCLSRVRVRALISTGN
jgi:ribosomal protein S27E